MKYTWNLVYRGVSEGSGTLMGDPLVALLTHRETGVFTPEDKQPADLPKGWVAGELVTTTKVGGRVLRARLIARQNGQWNWKGGFNTPGTRYCDFCTYFGYKVTVEAEKPFEESWFGRQLRDCGWVEEDREC